MFLPSVNNAQEDDIRKANALEQLTQFVNWPENIEKTATFTITVIGNRNFAKTLKEVYQTKELKNKKVEVNAIEKVSEIKNCNLLFVSKSVSCNIEQIMKVTHSQPILTITDSEEFEDKGVLLYFYCSRFELKLRTFSTFFSSSKNIPDVINFAKNTK